MAGQLRPEGIPPEHGIAPLPLPYCPMYVIENVLLKYDSYSQESWQNIYPSKAMKVLLSTRRSTSPRSRWHQRMATNAKPEDSIAETEATKGRNYKGIDLE